MTSDRQTVYVVDDEVSVRDSIKWLLDSVKMPVETFDSAHAFLSINTDHLRGCIVLDVRMPNMSGLELMKRIQALGLRIPIVFLSAHADVPMAVQALKDGAFDFLEKPYNNQRFLDCIQSALEHDLLTQAHRHADDDLLARLKGLTVREREIIDLVIAGKSNKEMARLLNISHKTVEAHRGRLMTKMGVTNVVDLVRLMATHYATQSTPAQGKG